MLETVVFQSEPEEMQVVTSKQPEEVHSETVPEFQCSETQTVLSRADANSQTTETTYSNFWGEDSLIGKELLESSTQGTTSLRSHGEAHPEINVQNKNIPMRRDNKMVLPRCVVLKIQHL